ncbi:hypothetical protein OG21DRAFT_1424027, partial [Imleria badia]
IKALTQLRNGGLIIKFDSTVSAAWLRQSNNKTKFLEKLEVPAEIHDRSYTVLVPFLPITAPLDDPQWFRAIKIENNLREDSLASAKWIKQKFRYSPNQRVVHALFTFLNPTATNSLLWCRAQLKSLIWERTK